MIPFNITSKTQLVHSSLQITQIVEIFMFHGNRFNEAALTALSACPADATNTAMLHN